MRNQRNHPLVRQARRCVIGVGVATGAVVAAGVVAAATAYADTGADVLGEAGQDLTQATQVLDGAPTASLDAEEATLLTEQEMLQTEGGSPLLSAQESLQAGLPAADQASLGDVDQQFLQAYQGVLDADQAFVAADQAGDLGSLTGLMDQLGVVQADLAIFPADFNVTAADIGAEVASLFNITDFLSF